MCTELDLREWGMTILRVVIGIAFVVHGGQKLFVTGFAGVTAYMAHIGIPLPGIAGPLVTLVEFFGGVALVVGLLSRWAALLLVCDMAVAILKVNIHRGFTGPGGAELPVVLLVANLAVAAHGSGVLSLEALFRGAKTAGMAAGKSAADGLAGEGGPGRGARAGSEEPARTTR